MNIHIRVKLVDKFYELRAKGKIPNVELRDFVNDLLERELKRLEEVGNANSS